MSLALKRFSFFLVFALCLGRHPMLAQDQTTGLKKADALFEKADKLLKTSPEEAILPLKEAQFIFKNQGEKAKMVNCILALAEIHMRLSDYDICYSLLTNANSLSLENELPDQHLMALTSLAKVSAYLEEFDRAMGYLDDALQVAKSDEKKKQILFLVGLRAYMKMYYRKDYQEANFLDMLSLYEDSKGPSPDSLMLLSASNFLGGAYRFIKKDIEKSKFYYLESISIAKATGDKYRAAIAYNNMGDMLLGAGQIKEAENIFQISMALGRELNSKLILYNCFRLLSKVSEANGNFQLALEQYRNYEQLRQKVLNEDLIRKTREIHSLYQVERKARENDKILAEKKLAQKEAEKKISTYRGLAIVTAVVLTSFFFLFFLNRRSLNKSIRDKKIIEEQNQQLIFLNNDLINQRKSAEAANEEAALAVRSKIDFFSMMTHELRTPLNAVIGTVQLLQEENPPPHQKKSLEILQFSAENLLSLVNDILDFNRIEAGKVELESKPFSLRHLLKEIRNSLKLKADDKNIELRLRIDKDLPEAFMGDKLRLGQVFYNLVSNAIKFTNKGFVEIEVRYYTEKPEANIFASVRDSGIGIAPESQKTIFEFFSQADSSIGRKFGGSGLGLTITKNLLSLMKTQIFLESKEGLGSTFYFHLSLLETNPAFLEKEPGEVSDWFENLEESKILFVEDVDFNRVVAERFFKKWNLRFDTAHTAAEAISMAKTQPYDLVLMDIQLPDMDGFAASAELRKSEFNTETPILAMTASPLSDIKEKMNLFGVQGYLPKPFVSQELKASIFHWLGQRKAK